MAGGVFKIRCMQWTPEGWPIDLWSSFQQIPPQGSQCDSGVGRMLMWLGVLHYPKKQKVLALESQIDLESVQGGDHQSGSIVEVSVSLEEFNKLSQV